MAVAQSSDSVAIRYVLPVLSMTSRLAVRAGWRYVEAACCNDYREQRGDTGAESDVYECLIVSCDGGI